MQIIRNEKIIKRNARIAQAAMIGGVLVLAGGMFLSFRHPEQFTITLIALVLGFALSQIGIYFSNRWVRKPRPDEALDQGLKGLDDKYTLYHYSTPVSHLLVGPCGVWILFPKHQGGTITYSKGKWHQKGGNLYLKIFAQEGLGRPDLEIAGSVDKILKYLKKKKDDNEAELPDIYAALVFINPDTNINISKDEKPLAETVPLAKLKDLIRKYTKAKTLSMEKVKNINELFAK